MKQPRTDDSDRQARQALGQALRAMHQLSGRTLRAVERDVSISDSTLSRYFRGQAVPAWPTVEKICAALGGDPASIRQLWTAAMAERSGTAFDTDASPGPEPDAAARDDPPRPRRRRPSAPGRTGWLWLAVGLFIGFALGATLTAASNSGSSAAQSPPAQVSVAPSPAATGTFCPWKYVVTDGNGDDVRVFDTPHRDSIIARYSPSEVFYAPEPPVIVSGMMRTAQGWIGEGNWIQRYHGSCHTGGP
ncbi:helix-turn-helix domain-containing protein [Streptomyces sp. RPT161]|uniref:helix-turn-helix domain-containing protein n=1 Tax=Streptomyces sp. RPT161 TaxID=3015993 RepID=UPI0022B8E69D|nr:helix-turn-helix transcriptional regulator [Streptomyces sp. RPT161]